MQRCLIQTNDKTAPNFLIFNPFLFYMDEKEKDKKINEIIKSCNEENVPASNLIYGGGAFLPQETIKKYKELEKDEEIEIFEVWNRLIKNIKVDSQRISKFYLRDIAVESKENHSLETFPELLNEIDSEGLMKVPFGYDLNKDGFKYKNKYLIFENVISRNFHFMDWIIRNWDNGFSIRLRPNFNYLGIPSTRRDLMLLSHWRGPKKFSNLNKFEQNLVIKGPNNFDVFPVNDKTEFLFEFRNGEWHLQMEEMVPLEETAYIPDFLINNKKYNFCTRYLHAIMDENLSFCTHIDGAIRAYHNDKNLRIRNNTNLSDENLKDICSRIKLFSFDSSEGIESFQEIIGLFFRENPYVLEFFEGETKETKELEEKRTYFVENNLNKRYRNKKDED